MKTDQPLPPVMIVNNLGLVHRRKADGTSCTAVTLASVRREVRSVQCLVYKLAPCRSCWPSFDSYDTFVGRIKAQVG